MCPPSGMPLFASRPSVLWLAVSSPSYRWLSPPSHAHRSVLRPIGIKTIVLSTHTSFVIYSTLVAIAFIISTHNPSVVCPLAHSDTQRTRPLFRIFRSCNNHASCVSQKSNLSFEFLFELLVRNRSVHNTDCSHLLCNYHSLCDCKHRNSQ